MRINRVVLFVNLFLILFLDSISQFKEIYPIKSNFLDVQVVSNSQAFIVGGDGTRGSIYKTTNAGTKWTKVSVPDSINPFGSFISVSFINRDTGFVLSWEQARILKTTNGGTSWTSLILNLGADRAAQIKFINSTTGFVRSEKGKIKTTDFGNTWTSLSIPVSNAQITSAYFVNEQVFFVIYDGVLYKTTNSGNSWIGPIMPGIYLLNYVYFLDENNGYAVTANHVWKTFNGGAGWIDLSNGFPGPSPKCMNFYDLQRGFWFEDPSKIRYTANSSTSFVTRFTSNQPIPWNALDMKNSFVCGIGQNSSLIISNDSGQTWTIRNIIPQLGQLRDIAFPTDSGGLVIGDFWGIFRTTDKADTWYLEEQSINIDNKYLLRFSPAKDTGFLDIGDSYTYVTYNKGNTFTFNTSWLAPFTGQFASKDYFLFNSKEIFGVGLMIDTPVIVHSINGGASWERLYIGSTSPLNAIHFPTWNTGYACGNDGKIWKTSNHGVSWTQQATPVTNHLRGLHFLDSLTGFAFGQINTILRTINGGSTWGEVQTFIGATKAIHFINDSKGFCFDHVGSVAVTANRGQSWTNLNLPAGNMLFDKVVVRADSTAFAIGEKRIYSLDLKPLVPLITGIPSVSSNDMNIRIFPNPTSGWLFVKFEKPLRLNKVLLYDMTGRLIRNYFFDNTVISSFQKHIGDLNSGVYLILCIESNKKRYSKRFVKE